MILFYNRVVDYLVSELNLHQGKFTIKNFSDKEIYVKIEQSVEGKEVLVLTSTPPPAENLLELFFLLDALRRSGVKKINLFFTYFGYARQSRVQPGEVGSAEFICDILKQFPLGTVKILHAHAAEELKKFLDYKNLIDYNFFSNVAKKYDLIVAPDFGASNFVKKISENCNKEAIFFTKVRTAHDQVDIKAINGNVKNKKVLLVDDMISTGSTLIQASDKLLKLGAKNVSAAATHGVFSDNAKKKIELSSLESVYVTNSIQNESFGKIKVINIVDFIKFNIT